MSGNAWVKHSDLKRDFDPTSFSIYEQDSFLCIKMTSDGGKSHKTWFFGRDEAIEIAAFINGLAAQTTDQETTEEEIDPNAFDWKV